MEGRIASVKSLSLRQAMIGARTVSDQVGNTKLTKNVEVGHRVGARAKHRRAKRVEGQARIDARHRGVSSAQEPGDSLLGGRAVGLRV